MKNFASGIDLLAGVDEVGRGLAGPVVAAADHSAERCKISGLNDSKDSKNPNTNHEGRCFQNAVAVGIGIKDNQVILIRFNIHEAEAGMMEIIGS